MYPLSLTVCALTILHTACATPMLPFIQFEISDATTHSPDDTHATIHSFASHGTFDTDDLVSDPIAADSLYAGLATFAHLPYVQCLQNDSLAYDIAFIGAPFDNGKDRHSSFYCV